MPLQKESNIKLQAKQIQLQNVFEAVKEKETKKLEFGHDKRNFVIFNLIAVVAVGLTFVKLETDESDREPFLLMRGAMDWN